MNLLKCFRTRRDNIANIRSKSEGIKNIIVYFALYVLAMYSIITFTENLQKNILSALVGGYLGYLVIHSYTSLLAFNKRQKWNNRRK